MTQNEIRQLADQALRVLNLKSLSAHIQLLDRRFNPIDERELLQSLESTINSALKIKDLEGHKGVTETRMIFNGLLIITVTKVAGTVKAHLVITVTPNYAIIETPYNPDCG